MTSATTLFTGIGGATRRQVAWFAVAGLCATAGDALVYFVLVHSTSIGHDGSKTLSFVVGTLIAYVINKFFTFQSRRRSIAEALRFFVLYATALLVNVGVNHGVLALGCIAAGLEDPPYPAWISVPAFLAATGCSTVLNFFGQKFWVFRAR